MTKMTVEQLYEKLCSERFQDPSNGDLYYNYFIYLYPPEKEYEMRAQIADIKEKISRPSNSIDVLTLDLFEEFCSFLKGRRFGDEYDSRFDFYLQIEKDQPTEAEKSLIVQANSEKFMQHIHNRIMEHVSKVDEYRRPYVFLYGIGNMFPYLRTSTLLNKYEEFNESFRYKIILFYPGEREGNSFKLFSRLEDHHTYRAIILMNE